MGQHQEPTIAVVDAVVVVLDPNDVVDVEHGNDQHHDNANSNTQTGIPNNQYKQQRYTAEPSEYSTNNRDHVTDIVVLQRQQPPAPQIIYGHLGRYECSMQCPFCQTTMMTRTKTSCDGLTWLFVFILFLVFWPLCWLPLCMPKCQRVHHYCSHCQRKVGITEPCS